MVGKAFVAENDDFLRDCVQEGAVMGHHNDGGSLQRLKVALLDQRIAQSPACIQGPKPFALSRIQKQMLGALLWSQCQGHSN